MGWSAVWAVLLASLVAASHADELPEHYFDLSLEELGQVVITVATGSPVALSRAPAVASVITAKDIKATGATNITQALESVPGLHVSANYQGAQPIFTFRGMYSVFNPQVLIMVNGVPINTLFVGSPDTLWKGLPVEAISRIEVIRGPGSAIYGADAFAGVINIITKTPDETNNEVGLRVGSFDTVDAWFSTAGGVAGFDMAFFLEYHKTDGHEEKLDADAQAFFDNVFGTAASRTRDSSVSLSEDNLDLRFEVSKENWRLRIGLTQGRDLGVYTGIARALDPEARVAVTRRNADLTWHDPTFTDDWDLKAQFSFLDSRLVLDDGTVFHVYPEGTAVFGDVTGDGLPDVLPDGMIGTPEHFERHYRLEFASLYKGFARHQLLLGVGWHLGDLYKIEQSKNSGLNPATNTVVFPTVAGTPLFSVSDTDQSFMTEGDRENYHAFLQDIWRLAENWELTAGLRYDHFSDFGSTTNPRAALVWVARDDLTMKLLYGEAFRSPSFAEMRARNNPAAWGNLGLNPETIKTTELAFDYRPTKALQFDMNFFRYRWGDVIRFVPDPNVNAQLTAQNAGRQTGHGMELSGNWRASDAVQLRGNVAWQRSTNEETNQDAGNAPEWQAYLRADWIFLPKWHLNGQLNWVGEREREPGDTRDPVDEFKTVDLTLRRSAVKQRWEFAIAARNVFDEEIKEPSLNVALPTGVSIPLIPNDLPQAGRSLFAETRYFF